MRQPISAPTGTITFLFTDIEGSTKLWEADPAAMRTALMRHDELMRQAILESGGYVFKTVGDAFCAAFNTAPDAVGAAMSAQLALLSEPWQVNPPVRARMAIHTGAAQERDGDYYGQAVNRAARLLSAGHGGQTLVSLVTQELVRDDLPPSVSLLDLGDANLKDLARSERVYQLQHSDLPFRFPPLRVLNRPAQPNNLPQQPTSFIGRERELEDIDHLLERCRLLTLAGSGGAGKTRLALQAAADLLDQDGDGVWLVELAPLSDPNLVPGEIARTLGIKETAGQAVEKTLSNALQSKTVVLVLDNCEHLIEACAEIASELLRSCPSVRVLATSREPLGVPGEQVYRIPSLSIPSGTGGSSDNVEWNYTAESLSQYDAVRLFIERAKAASPSFTISDRNAPAVAQVCYRLDGIPLAVELAAARVRSLPVEQVNARLDSRFLLLTGGARTLLPRQQTLRALIDWSYDLLDAKERAMLQALSVFAGGWTLEAAEAVCSSTEEDIEAWEALDLLTSLVDKSLAVYDDLVGEPGAARYSLLETIRRYAHDRLEESDASDAARRRHRNWCLALAQQAARNYEAPDAVDWLSRLDAEHDNMRAALAGYERDLKQPDVTAEASNGLALAVALAGFWQLRGFLTEGRRWLSKLLPPLDEKLETAAWPQEALPLLSKGLTAYGSLSYMQGDFAIAIAMHQESLRIRRQTGDRKGVAATVSNLGNVYLALGDFSAARERYQESLAIRREVGDKQGVAGALGNLGLVLVNLGDHLAAAPLLKESLEIMRQLGDRRGIAVSLNNLGSMMAASNDRDAADRYFEQSLEAARQIKDQRRIANALANLGSGAAHRGDYPKATLLLQEALQIRRAGGDQLGIARALHLLADVAAAQKRWLCAAILSTSSVKLREQIAAELPEEEQRKLNQTLASAREAVGIEACSAAEASGREMTWEQAAHFALSEAA